MNDNCNCHNLLISTEDNICYYYIDAHCIRKNYLCIAGLAANVSVTSVPCGVVLIQDILLNLWKKFMSSMLHR